MKKEFKFNLGEVVQDRITGFIGMIRVRSQYLTGCNVYGLQDQKLDKDGKPVEWVYFDESLLSIIKKEKTQEQRKTGGPLNSNQYSPER